MRWWMWWTALALAGFTGCGGSSTRRSSGGADESSRGGMSGSSGVSAGTGNAPQPTGGRGGSGGSSHGGSGATAGQGGADAGDGGIGADAGAGGVVTCNALAGGNTCSFEEACALLGCEEPWSHYDSGLCWRENCRSSEECGAGERCVPSPVAGRFFDHCSNAADSCETGSSGCECLFYEECMPSAICLSADEFPPERDCPIANLDCAGLPPPALVGSVQACADAIAEMLEVCN